MLLAAPVHAAQVPLSDSDFSLGLDEYTEAGSWASLDTSNLDGVFGPHRCQCPQSFSPVLQLTSAGQTDVGTSTIGVTFYLGSNCYSAPASCAALGQSSFSASEGASPPTFSSSAVFEAATESTSPSCTSLSASSTTLWAIMTQNGTPLTFSLTIDLPVSNTTVGTPTGVTAQPANEGVLVSWSAPADASLVAGYQVLCLPRPITASAAGYESCGLVSNPAATVITPDDETQLCSAELSASTTSVRVTGLTNGTTYTVAVIAIDPSGGTGAPSSPASATPQTTIGFWDDYKQAGGAATGCSLSGRQSSRVSWPMVGTTIAAVILFVPRHRRRKCRHRVGRIALLAALLAPAAAPAQDSPLTEPPPQESSLPQASPLGQSLGERDDATLTQPVNSPSDSSPEWGIELGVSLYRPDVDGEFRNGAHPFADTFSSSRHILWAAELDRYLLRRFGTWGIGLGAGYYRTTAAAFLSDGVTRSGDQTALRLVPISLSLLYFANGLPGLRTVPLIPYAKLGLDGTIWTASSTGESNSPTGLSLGWHAAAGLNVRARVARVRPHESGRPRGPLRALFRVEILRHQRPGLERRASRWR